LKKIKEQIHPNISFSIGAILPKDFEKDGFYNYDGSLTTPPFSENILWHVFKITIPVSSSQVSIY
jgi:carbonic anhydrase